MADGGSVITRFPPRLEACNRLGTFDDLRQRAYTAKAVSFQKRAALAWEGTFIGALARSI